MPHIQCTTCGATVTLDAGHRTARCPYCASPQVIERPPALDLPNPDFVVGFALGRAAAEAVARRWLRSRSVFTVSGVRTARIADIQGVYLPVYLYSAAARSQYAASIGENYTETQHYTTTDSKGHTHHHTRTVVKTEHRPLQGVRDEYVADVVVTASRGVPNAELQAVEPFDLRALRRYSPAMISGWIAEEPSLGFDACLAQARAESMAVIGANLTGFMPGDSHRDLRYQTQFREESLVSLLAPIWVLALRYDDRKPPFRLLVNGQTGAAHGKAPLSWRKIGLAVGLGLLLVAGVVLALVLAANGGGG
jgi:hypothetical protein